MSDTQGRLEKSLSYLSWQWAAACVLDVFRQNQERDSAGATILKSSDCWCITEQLRQDIFTRACRFWCNRTGLDHTYFPLSVDAVARLYFKIRKRNTQEIEAFVTEVEQAIKRNGHRPSQHTSLFDVPPAAEDST